MKCPNPNCNKELSNEWKSCPFCGFKLIKDDNTERSPEWLQEIRLSSGGENVQGGDTQEKEHSNQPADQSVKIFSSHSDDDLIITVGNTSFKMIYVKGGTFQMGATPEQGFSLLLLDSRKPVHTVILSDFFLGETVVTKGLWGNVTGEKIIQTNEFNLPKDNVSWYDCNNFIQKLNQITGKKFRLPTEAEWEYAARGGKYGSLSMFKYSGDNDIDAVAWYEDNSDGKTHPVKTKKPNKLGLYDMSGNVEEWCNDYWQGKYSNQQQTNPQGPVSGRYRVSRGGCYSSQPLGCQVSIRNSWPPEYDFCAIGFRLALSI